MEKQAWPLIEVGRDNTSRCWTLLVNQGSTHYNESFCSSNKWQDYQYIMLKGCEEKDSLMLLLGT